MSNVLSKEEKEFTKKDLKKHVHNFHYWRYKKRRFSPYNDGWWDSGVSPQIFRSNEEIYELFLNSQK